MTALIVSSLLLSVTDCRPRRSAAAAPGANVPGVSAKCSNGFVFTQGPYKYENNQWGQNKAQGAFEQCLLERSVGDRTEYGWTWNWPGFNPSVFAYPEIIWGWKPWSGGRSTDSRFPRKVANIEYLTIDYEVETQAKGSYNLAPEIWITSGRGRSHDANPSLISSEIMFWMDYAGDARPAGKVISHPTVDGITYELWKANDIGDKGGGSGWVLYTFKSPTIQHRGTISVHTLLRHMLDNGHVRPDEYVASVEFGNEVMGGSGTTWVKRFDIEARP